MTTRDLVLIALFAAIVVVLGLIPPVPLGFIPVPITAQSMGVMLAGCILGAKRGALAYALFVLLVAMGLPVLSGGHGGLNALFGATGGYIFGWIIGAFVTGLAAERFARASSTASGQTIGFFAASILGGIGVVYACGMPWWSFVAGTPIDKVLIGSLAFLPGDLIKAAIAALAARAVMVGYPLLPKRA
ncbi:biotin transporter BioY [Agrobacterium vitis]|uniref:biotin transporter BioY n=1 Tax=Agrobacterium vitis TaxID=373 RepID=UPI001571A48C|nr:biotin transporter BioY [Agrobacterium vitis]NSZ15870.1 biotin transporter BioY [Agrobacterium vitis]QZO04672.1 biotin transporter BioY [Agrobacterium vitis]UJL86816.1 biotin transporter BioY [Agrobacterium vitis]